MQARAAYAHRGIVPGDQYLRADVGPAPRPDYATPAMQPGPMQQWQRPAYRTSRTAPPRQQDFAAWSTPNEPTQTWNTQTWNTQTWNTPTWNAPNRNAPTRSARNWNAPDWNAPNWTAQNWSAQNWNTPSGGDEHGPLESMAAAQAGANGVPMSLVDRVIKRESGYNPRAVSAGNYGLMQIRLGTARAMGYGGSAEGLLDPQTNMTYAVRYLAGAYRAAGGDESRAVALYARGYYDVAAAQGFSPYGSAATQTEWQVRRYPPSKFVR
jgi:soluble lytic murein transglycosylase-like protein